MRRRLDRKVGAGSENLTQVLTGLKKHSRGQLCASSRGKTEAASGIHENWA